MKPSDKKIKALFEQDPGVVASGLFYGYPACCIEAFSTSEHFHVWKKYPALASMGTGYCPCMECAPQVQLDWSRFQAEKITPHRSCSTPFPSEEKDIVEFDMFFIHLSLKLGLDPQKMSEGFMGGKTIRALLKRSNSMENITHPVIRKY